LDGQEVRYDSEIVARLTYPDELSARKRAILSGLFASQA